MERAIVPRKIPMEVVANRVSTTPSRKQEYGAEIATPINPLSHHL